jgi:hypothetical protein
VRRSRRSFDLFPFACESVPQATVAIESNA